MKFKEYLKEMMSTSTAEYYTSDKELLREAIIAEHDATNLYAQLATKAQSQEVKRVLLHVAEEEKHHIHEFNALLEKLDPEHEEAEEKGEEEVEDMGIHLPED